MGTTIDKRDPKPLYSQIAEWIREKIYAKEWETNHRLPAEEQLAKQLQVSRGTLKKAIASLVREGLLVQIHGKGTFVAAPKVSHPLAQELVSFAESMKRQGLNFKTNVLEQELVAPKRSVQEKLAITSEQRVLFLKRVREIDGDPVIVIENYINIDLCKGIHEADFERETLFSEIEKRSGKKIAFGIRTFEARVVEDERAERLSLPDGAPVLYLDQLVYLEGDRPVEMSNVWLRSDKYVVSSILKRS